MKKKKLLVTLVLALSVGIGATAYAASNNATSDNPNSTALGIGRVTGVKGYDFITNVLKSKLSVSDSDIINARNSGKTMYDLAKDKGVTFDQFKAAVIEEKSKAIDEAVNKGTITKEQGDTLKERIKENSSNCTTPGEMNGRGMSNGACRGQMNRGNQGK